MNMYLKQNFILHLFCIFIVFAGVSQASELPEILGVFGLNPVDETTALALWVPLNEEGSIEGIRWYNNDERTIFPEIRVLAGEANQPGILANASVFGEGVVGGSLLWSELYFPQPLASTSSGLYVIFCFPSGSEFQNQGENGGAGIGYISGEGINQCWVTGDGESWDGFTIPHQMAVQPIINTNKTSNVLVLSPPGESQTVANRTIPTIDQDHRIRATPNPFNPLTEVRFSLNLGGSIDFAVFDLRGRLVKQLESGFFTSGDHLITWNGKNNSGQSVSSGVYFLRLVAEGTTSSMAITLTK